MSERGLNRQTLAAQSIWSKPGATVPASRYCGGKHPPMARGEGRWRREDFLTQAGAVKLGEIARAAWAAQGKDVPYTVVQVTTVTHGDPMFAPRFPTLVNGMPVT